MELYALDLQLRRTAVIDRFKSLIWTERFSDQGDFELYLNSTPETRKMFVSGLRLAHNESYRVMEVENLLDTVAPDGTAALKVTGRSIEKILRDRIVKESFSAIDDTAPFIVADTPAGVCRYIFDRICRTGIPFVQDKIPFLQPGSLFPIGTIGEPSLAVQMELTLDNLFDTIKRICDLYDLGFRLVRNFDTSQLYFDIYAGNDRTTSQTTLPAVVFSPELDNLQNTSELHSSENSKNVAYVFAKEGYVAVYPTGVDPDTEGFERRVLLVEVTDVPAGSTPAEVTTWLTRKGNEELSKNRSFSAFDGELSQQSNYVYGIDYDLGDLVEVRNRDGFTNNMRVTEQIFVSDREGERRYPTLAISLAITPGSWLAWDYNQVWADLGLTEYWADQP